MEYAPPALSATARRITTATATMITASLTMIILPVSVSTLTTATPAYSFLVSNSLFLFRTASELTSARLDGDENNRARVPAESRSSAPTGGRSVVSMNDLLDDYHGHSDTASFGGYSTGNYANYSQAPAQHTNQQYAGYR